MKRAVFLLLAASSSLVGVVRGSESPVSVSSREMSAIDDIVFFVKNDHETSVAFLLEDHDAVWLVSGSSALGTAKTSIITNAHGDKVLFSDKLEVAKNRDLIRFRADRPTGLIQAASCGFDEELHVFSRCIEEDHDGLIKRLEKERDELQETKKNVRNLLSHLKSSGQTTYYSSNGKITVSELSKMVKEIGVRVDEISMEINECKRNKQKRLEAKNNAVKLKEGFLLQGQAVALGPDHIEISTEITRHDKGGPVLNSKQEVVGVSSHLVVGENGGLPDWVIEGTQFENVRQFAIRLDVVEWVPVEWIYYHKESSFVRESFDSLRAFAQITETIYDNYFRRISVKTENKDVQEWIEGHNRMITQTYTERRIIKDFRKLIEMIEELEKDAGRIHRVSIPYFQQQLTDLQTLYRKVRERMEQVLENMES